MLDAVCRVRLENLVSSKEATQAKPLACTTELHFTRMLSSSLSLLLVRTGLVGSADGLHSTEHDWVTWSAISLCKISGKTKNFLIRFAFSLILSNKDSTLWDSYVCYIKRSHNSIWPNLIFANETNSSILQRISCTDKTRVQDQMQTKEHWLQTCMQTKQIHRVCRGSISFTDTRHELQTKSSNITELQTLINDFAAQRTAP